MKKSITLLLALCVASFAFAADLIPVDKALKKVFPKAVSFKAVEIILDRTQQKLIEEKADIEFGQSHLPQAKLYTAFFNDKVLGYAIEDTVIGKWGPIHYLAGITPEGSVKEVIILDYQEIRGKPIAKKRFLKQYKNKNLQHPVRLRKDINGITGATISSRSLTDGVRKNLYIYDLLKADFDK